MKKLLKPKNNLILLLVVAMLFTLVSCGGSMTDDGVRKELERLLPVSYELNEIFWGKGLPTKDIDSTDRMLPVQDECGYKTTKDILDKAATVFSAEYLAEIKSAVFTDIDDIDPRYADVNGVLKADTKVKGFDIKGNILVETAKIKKQNRTTVIVTADYEDGGSTELTLKLQGGKWYLDSPTY